MSFSDLQAAHRRLLMLELLAEDMDYAINNRTMKSELAARGEGVSSDLVRADFDWLQEMGLITVEDLDVITVARITTRGHDVAKGYATVKGVARPGPGV